MKKLATVIAADRIRPEGCLRPAQPGEVLYLPAGLARELVKLGVAVPAKRAPEFAVRTPKESR
jgi:hypothetical protein